RYKIKLRFFWRSILRHIPCAIKPCLRYAILHGTSVRTGALGDPCLLLGDGRAGRNFAIIFFYFLVCFFWSNVAGDDQRGIVGTIVCLEPLVHVVKRSSIKVSHLANYRP